MSERRLISTGSPFEKKIGYSRAVVQGDWCFVAGTTGYDYTIMSMPDDIAEQARNCFKTIEATLTDAGFFLSDIVRVQYTITDRTLAPAATEVFGEYLSDIRPAATMVIADLMEPEMLVEVEVTAFKG
ncbi:MAG: RidA family protein [Pseudomonadota bacterium]